MCFVPGCWNEPALLLILTKVIRISYKQVWFLLRGKSELHDIDLIVGTFSGMNIARALGDKFLKEQDRAFSALPHISDVWRLTLESKAMVIVARLAEHHPAVQMFGCRFCFRQCDAE
jgi:hypothetical protein